MEKIKCSCGKDINPKDLLLNMKNVDKLKSDAIKRMIKYTKTLCMNCCKEIANYTKQNEKSKIISIEKLKIIKIKVEKMRFKFCGNVDCPDWLITEIIYISKITPVKLRILGNLICKYIMKEGDTVKIKKILEEMNLSPEEITIVISSLCFIIKSSAKFNIDDMMLSQELQQLGLPQDTADAISKVFKKNKDVLRNYLKEDIFSFKRVSDVHYKTSYCMADKYNNFECKNEKEKQEK